MRPRDTNDYDRKAILKNMSTTITPFLLFAGQAEEAMNLYVSVFPDAEVEELKRYGAEGAGAEGTVELGTFSLSGQKVMCTDSAMPLDFTFTPASSLFVACSSEAEFDKTVEPLAKDGNFLMPPDNYGFSQKYAWLEDRFGVSWQINLP